METRAVVIGLTGHAACGKGTFADYLQERYGFRKFTLSDVLKEEAERRGLLKGKSMEEVKFYLSKFGDEWRKQTGRQDIVGHTLLEKLKKERVRKAVVDGFRGAAEVEMFRKSFAFTLVRVDASLETRWKRRLAQDPDAKRAEFEERDRVDVDTKGLGKALEMADITIDNNGPKEKLFKQIDAIVARLDSP